MALHPLPVDLALSDLLSALKNFKTDPGEGAHAAWHGAGYALNLFHKNHEGFKASAAKDKKLAKALADLERTAPTIPTEGLAAIDWATIKPWAKKLLEFLLMLMG